MSVAFALLNRPFCKANGIGVIAYSPLMQGILTGVYETADAVPTYRARSRHFDGTLSMLRF
jgi:aryl-alcohol dehydrogenase-like predicted oxidoreductase